MRIKLSRRHTAHAAALAFALLSAPLAVFGQAPSPAQVANRFAGQWVEDLSRQKSGAAPNLRFRKGADGLEELRGPYTNPVVIPVRFGTDPYGIAGSSDTVVWKQLGGGRFERALMTNSGKTLTIREITVSPDGETLTEITEFSLPGDKKGTMTIAYSRASGSGQTLEGVWKPETVRSDTPRNYSIQAVGSTLRVSTGDGTTFVLTFDGKPAAFTGPGKISGEMVTGKIDSDREIEFAITRLGAPTSTVTWTLSADGKTLTNTNLMVAPDASKEPSVWVFLKQ